MREAVIVSTARTPIANAYRVTISNLTGPSPTAHSLIKRRFRRTNFEIISIRIGGGLGTAELFEVL